MPIRVTNSTSGTGSNSFPTLRQGSSGSAVEQLQQRLEDAGFDVGTIDGSFGPHTRAAVEAFQHDHGLSADGVVGPATWAALNGVASPAPSQPSTPSTPAPAPSGSLRQRMLDLAQSQVGTVEATNRNDGAVLKYPRAFGRGSESYCADFASWVMSNSGKPTNEFNTRTWVSDLKSAGAWKGKTNPQPGDLVFFDWDKDGKADHVGLVKSVNANGTIETIEGNTTNPITGREGVWNRTRTLSTVLGFASP